MIPLRFESFDIEWPEETRIRITHKISNQETGAMLEIRDSDLTYRFPRAVESKPRRDKYAHDIGAFVTRCLLDSE